MLQTPYWVNETLRDTVFLDGVDASNVTQLYRVVIEYLFKGESPTARESVLNSLLAAEHNRTFSMGNGIAIPHLIWELKRSRTIWVHLKGGVVFPGTGMVRFAFFAFDVQHRLTPIMAKACDILTGDEFVQRVISKTSGEALKRYISDGLLNEQERYIDHFAASGETESAEATIVNSRGLHARAAMKFVVLMGQYDCAVTVTRGGEEVDGRELMGLMMLGAGFGTKVGLRTTGPDASVALAEAVKLFKEGFDELEEDRCRLEEDRRRDAISRGYFQFD
jgi:phosphocarrier protein